MRLQNLDLNLLVVLDALLEEKSVTLAANRLHVTQPAVSSALRRLRAHYSDELLVQLGRKMVLTPLAESLHAPVRESLLQLEGLLFTRPVLDPATVSRRVVLVASDYIVSVWLAEFIRDLAWRAPGIELDVVPPSPSSERMFATGEADFSIRAQSLALDGHPRLELFRDRWCCVTWTGNERVQTALSVETFFALRHVVAGFGPARRRSIVHLFLERTGREYRSGGIMPSFSLAMEAVIGTEHVAIVPQKMAEIYARRLPLQFSPVPIELPPIVEVLQWHSHRESDPLGVWLRERLSAPPLGEPSAPLAAAHAPRAAVPAAAAGGPPQTSGPAPRRRQSEDER